MAPRPAAPCIGVPPHRIARIARTAPHARAIREMARRHRTVATRTPRPRGDYRVVPYRIVPQPGCRQLRLGTRDKIPEVVHRLRLRPGLRPRLWGHMVRYGMVQCLRRPRTRPSPRAACGTRAGAAAQLYRVPQIRGPPGARPGLSPEGRRRATPTGVTGAVQPCGHLPAAARRGHAGAPVRWAVRHRVGQEQAPQPVPDLQARLRAVANLCAKYIAAVYRIDSATCSEAMIPVGMQSSLRLL